MNKFYLLIFLSLFSVKTAFGQLPPVGTIDFYGLRVVSVAEARAILTIKPGDDAAAAFQAIEANRKLLKSLRGVEDAAISLVCCDGANGKTIVFVGVREKGAPVLSFRPAPTGAIRLPENIIKAGREFDAAFAESLKERNFSEDDSAGHAFFGNARTRAAQKSFIDLANRNLKILRRVLRESADGGERALAAQIIAYYKDKRAVVGDLLFGATDADGSVRNNATRALIIIALYAQANPRLNVKIPGSVFVPMLDSLEWTDRNKAIEVLNALTRTRDARLLAELKTKSLPSLAEMAGWQSANHAESAFRVLGRVAGFTEAEIEAAWRRSDRDEQIKGFLEKANKK